MPKSTRAKINSIPLGERPTLTIDEFCGLVGIGISSFYRAVAAGDLKPRRYGRRVFITQEEMKRFVAAMPVGDQGRGQD